jgi:hypothetical protein
MWPLGDGELRVGGCQQERCMAEASFPTSCRGSPPLALSSNITPTRCSSFTPAHTRTRPWATAVSSAGQPAAIAYRPPLAALLRSPAEPHSHRPSATPAAMDDLREQVELLESSANLSTSISDIQQAIDQLTAARAKIAAGADPSADAGELY